MSGSNSLHFGDITGDSQLIFKEYFKHTGYADRIALRDEIIRTDGVISAIRATDISGQNGLAVITAFSNNFVQLALSSDGAGKGFDFRVEIYCDVEIIEPDEEPTAVFILGCNIASEMMVASYYGYLCATILVEHLTI